MKPKLENVNSSSMAACLHQNRPSPGDKAMQNMEKPFMVDLDRAGAESALQGLGTGAFLLRPKDSSALVVSVRLATPGSIEHALVRSVIYTDTFKRQCRMCTK
jgi:hypothetical protein